MRIDGNLNQMLNTNCIFFYLEPSSVLQLCNSFPFIGCFCFCFLNKTQTLCKDRLSHSHYNTFTNNSRTLVMNQIILVLKCSWWISANYFLMSAKYSTTVHEYSRMLMNITHAQFMNSSWTFTHVIHEPLFMHNSWTIHESFAWVQLIYYTKEHFQFYK